jgi:hypothetical protein
VASWACACGFASSRKVKKKPCDPSAKNHRGAAPPLAFSVCAPYRASPPHHIVRSTTIGAASVDRTFVDTAAFSSPGISSTTIVVRDIRGRRSDRGRRRWRSSSGRRDLRAGLHRGVRETFRRAEERELDAVEAREPFLRPQPQEPARVGQQRRHLIARQSVARRERRMASRSAVTDAPVPIASASPTPIGSHARKVIEGRIT